MKKGGGEKICQFEKRGTRGGYVLKEGIRRTLIKKGVIRYLKIRGVVEKRGTRGTLIKKGC